MKDVDLTFMAQALDLAKLSAHLGEVPVGSVIVIGETVIGFGINQRETRASVIEHAEMQAIRMASESLGNWRLSGASLYSTLEPCIMCAGAMLHARIKRLVFGASDPKFGAIESLYSLAADARLNHQIAVRSGVMAQNSAQLLKSFFLRLRAR